jgi:hypothetical protein
VPYVKALDLDPRGYATNLGGGPGGADCGSDNMDNVPLDALHEEDPLKLARAYCRAAEVPEWVAEAMREQRNVDVLVGLQVVTASFAIIARVTPPDSIPTPSVLESKTTGGRYFKGKPNQVYRR